MKRCPVCYHAAQDDAEACANCFRVLPAHLKPVASARQVAVRSLAALVILAGLVLIAVQLLV